MREPISDTVRTLPEGFALGQEVAIERKVVRTLFAEEAKDAPKAHRNCLDRVCCSHDPRGWGVGSDRWNRWKSRRRTGPTTTREYRCRR